MRIFAPYMIRVSGVMIDDGAILIIKQKTLGREWFLPGGMLEDGETLAECVEREVFEETGFVVKAKRLISVADTDFKDPPLVHILFTVEKVSGSIKDVSLIKDKNPITEIRFVDIGKLSNYGFSDKYIETLKNGFKDAPSYVGRDPLFDFEMQCKNRDI